MPTYLQRESKGTAMLQQPAMLNSCAAAECLFHYSLAYSRIQFRSPLSSTWPHLNSDVGLED